MQFEDYVERREGVESDCATLPLAGRSNCRCVMIVAGGRPLLSFGSLRNHNPTAERKPPRRRGLGRQQTIAKQLVPHRRYCIQVYIYNICTKKGPEKRPRRRALWDGKYQDYERRHPRPARITLPCRKRAESRHHFVRSVTSCSTVPLSFCVSTRISRPRRIKQTNSLRVRVPVVTEAAAQGPSCASARAHGPVEAVEKRFAHPHIAMPVQFDWTCPMLACAVPFLWALFPHREPTALTRNPPRLPRRPEMPPKRFAYLRPTLVY